MSHNRVCQRRRPIGSCLAVFLALVEVVPVVQHPTGAGILGRYASGEYGIAHAAAVQDPDALIRMLEREGEGWIRSAPASPRVRRLIAAAFALEAADATLATSRRVRYRTALEWGCRQLGEETGSPAALLWDLASVALVQRANDWAMLIGSRSGDEPRMGARLPVDGGHLAHMTRRHPREARLRLAAAVAEETRVAASHGIHPEDRSLRSLAALAKQFGELSTSADVSAEARLRHGAVSLRMGALAQALDDFAAAARVRKDAPLLHLAHLFSAVAYERAGDPSNAARSYRMALAVVPRAQSATTRLAALLLSEGLEDEAAEVSEAYFSGAPEVDPWRLYHSGDARMWPAYLSRLREALR